MMRLGGLVVALTACLVQPIGPAPAQMPPPQQAPPPASSPAPDESVAPPVAATPAPAPHSLSAVAPLSADARDCSAAHDHCLRPGTWLVDEGGDVMVPAYESAGHWYAWRDQHELHTGAAWHTAPASLDNLPTQGQRVAIAPAPLGSERDANGASWPLRVMQFLDADNQRINTADGWIPLARVRVKLDSHALQ